ncbi:TonB family protein, partial [bacterium]|nr:TonB family protein [bacterium]
FLTIEQTGKVYHHHLSNGSGFTIGQHPANDVTLYGDNIPKRHTLIVKKNGHYELKLKNYMTGEVQTGNSRLAFDDMIAHQLLSLKGNSFLYPLTHGKAGYVRVGDAKISFKFVTAESGNGVIKALQDFRGFSWTRATVEELRRDLPFKTIVLALIVFHALLMSYVGKFSTQGVGNLSGRRVPERFAKIIVKNPIETDLKKESTTNIADRTKQSEADKKSRKKEETKPATPEKQGLLGLLTGTGTSNQAGSLADVLLDKGLAKELDAVMANSELEIGNGSSDLSSDLDNLIAFNEESGIDDLLGDVGTVESVDLGERARVQVDQVGSMTGSEEALGKRSEESIRAVIRQNEGRLTYTYKKYLRKNRDFRGKLVLDITIAASGRVESVTIKQTNTNDAEFDREVLNFVRKWKFPAIDLGSVTVTVPLFFNKIG